MNSKSTLVSIIIPSFNGEEYLALTIESCLCQTYANIEVIIVDDGSTDRSVDIAKKYALRDSRVKVLVAAHEGHLGAINKGLDIVKGEYVKILSQDDLLLPYSIEYQARSLIYFQAEIMVAECTIFRSEELMETRKKLPPKLLFSPSDNIHENFLNFMHRETGSFSGSLFLTCIIREAGRFPASLKNADELNVLLRFGIAFPKTRVVYHNAPELLLKRVGYYSAAIKFKSIKWLLMSLRNAAERYLEKKPPETEKLKKYIFNRLYIAMIYSYRNGLVGDAVIAFNIWKKSGLTPPSLQPWYHNVLHRRLDFIFAERTLSILRKMVSPFRYFYKKDEYDS